jgi:phosphate transport system protein
VRGAKPVRILFALFPSLANPAGIVSLRGVITVDRSFDIQLNSLKKLVLAMGAHVEAALELATQGLTNQQVDKFLEVHDVEQKINAEHVQVDSQCLHFLAQRGPVAKDLRFIFSIIKLNADLERMGDQTVNMAFTGKDYIERKPTIPWLNEIEEMSRIVRQMVRGSLDSFVREDVDLAKKILLMDDDVDRRKTEVFKKMTVYMRDHSDSIEPAMDLILIARNLERLGDHATNIAEEVIFVSTGEDVRHGGKYSS